MFLDNYNNKIHTFLFFFSSNNIKNIDPRVYVIEENEVQSKRNETASNLSGELSSKEVEIQPVDIISNKTVRFSVCQNPK